MCGLPLLVDGQHNCLWYSNDVNIALCIYPIGPTFLNH